MKRKLFTLIAAVALMTTVAYSQVSFGVRAGVNFQNLNGKDNAGDKLENKITPGFHAGVDVAIPIAQDFYIQPGLLFSTKGAKYEQEAFKAKFSISYLELPIHLAYKPKLGNGKLILGFGPYLGYGIAGKVKPDEGNDIDIKFKNKLSADELTQMFSGQTIYMKGLDAGADIFFGYEFAFKLSVQMNAQLGLVNLYPDYTGNENDKSIWKNTGFGLSLGYRF